MAPSCLNHGLIIPRLSMLAADNSATIGVDGLAADVACVLAGQEDICRCHLTGLTRATHLGLTLPAVNHLLWECRWDKWCPDWAGGHSIDPDTLLRQLIGQSTSE
eukprot:GHUV01054737.1.p1 GENE.GHUV01054737.1~~GHUV01054737.1.p1  ORF type:complete len:105 (+),score=3.17 GHUV01054737.1:482-796(+)